MIIYFSQTLRSNEVAPTHPLKYSAVNYAADELPAEVILSTSSPLGPGTLLISRDGEDDVNTVRIHTARTSVSDIEYQNVKRKPPIQSKLSIPNGSSHQEKPKQGCDILILLKACWSWFCGLDDSRADDDHDNTDNINTSYHCLQRKAADNEQNEARNSMLQHLQERPMIKWILNGNLAFLIFIEIALFIIFSLPVKYTFWRE